jgi:hypothetical protein
MSEMDRPKRDVSARTAIGECDHCGGNAHSLLGGEHIWKCSEIIPVEAVKALADEWDEHAESEHKNAQELAEVQTWERAADKLRELTREVDPSTTDIDPSE